MSDSKLTFWEHLDELRASIFKIVIITLLFGIVAFFFKEALFHIVLAPKQDGFITYEIFRSVMAYVSQGNGLEHFSVNLINTGLADQFLTHIKVALCAGFLCASPYSLYALFRFVSPALYANEKKYVFRVVFSGYTMFLCGVLLNYFLIFPLTFRFLGTYQVSAEVENLISLHSYISTLMLLSILMGIVFEMPILAWLFAKLGFLSSDFMRKYRKHAIVIITVIAAVITPTADIFTLLLVSVPMYVLYEISIAVVSRTNSSNKVAKNC